MHLQPKLHECITEKECQKVLSSIDKLKEIWVPGSFVLKEIASLPPLPYYILGAQHKDAFLNGHAYYKHKVKQTNPILREHFSDLYESVRATLTQVTGREVIYEDAFALPGFFIYQYSDFFHNPSGYRIHFDLQFKAMYWNYRNIDFKNYLSFTLAIKLPSGGGGLNYWDIFYNQAKGMSDSALSELREQTDMHYIGYEVGKMVIHEGIILHQIAPLIGMKPGDERITLQGHGLLCDHILRVFW